MPTILIAASGTGGHLFPALAVAEALPNNWDVRWLGVPDRLEAKLVPRRYKMMKVKVGGLHSAGIRRLKQLISLLFSTLKVRELLRQEDVKLVFTTGGYISAPAILAAKLCGVPVIIHESNVIPGKVTRYLGRFCDRIALGLPLSNGYALPSKKLIITGTPVRASFLESNLLPDWVPPGEGPLLVVMGGSQGALGLNRMVRTVLPELLEDGCRVVHLTGQNDESPDKLVHKYFVEKQFSDEIPGLFQHADLVISRAGAGAITELSICGTPAIFVPYPFATDCHQEANAALAASYGAGVIVHQNESNGVALKKTIRDLLCNRLYKHNQDLDPLIQMQDGMKLLAVRDAHLRVVELLKKLIE